MSSGPSSTSPISPTTSDDLVHQVRLQRHADQRQLAAGQRAGLAEEEEPEVA